MAHRRCAGRSKRRGWHNKLHQSFGVETPVNINNVRIEQVPDRLLAAAAGLRHRPLFEATAEERADVNVGARLKGITA